MINTERPRDVLLGDLEAEYTSKNYPRLLVVESGHGSLPCEEEDAQSFSCSYSLDL